MLAVLSVGLRPLYAVMDGCPAQVHPQWAVRDHPDLDDFAVPLAAVEATRISPLDPQAPIFAVFAFANMVSLADVSQDRSLDVVSHVTND